MNIPRELVKISKLLIGKRLQLTDHKVEKKVSEQLKKIKLKARNRGDWESAVISGAYYSKKHDKPCYIYNGNSYMNSVWRATFKKDEALSPVNNTGSYMYIVEPDMTLTKWDIAR